VQKTLPQTHDDEDSRDSAPASLQERKQELVRSAIWDAATDLFADRGYDETTVDEIALKAGISRRSYFRYFSSKSDLMAYGTVGYGASLTGAIEACPRQYTLPEIFRHSVLLVATQCAGDPRARKIMEIAAKYPAAREALQSRNGELQNQVQAAFESRSARPSKDLMPRLLAGLMLSILAVIFQAWFEQGQEDISATAEQVLATLGQLVSHDAKPSRAGRR
jgi:AcrR family transcriptional regulator